MTRSPWEDLRCGLYLGSIEFGEKLRALVGTRSSQAEYPRAHRQPDRPALDELRRAVCSACQVTPQQLQHSRREPARALLACLARDLSAAPLGQLTLVFGVKDSGVSKLVMAGRRIRQTPWGCERVAEILTRLETDWASAKRK